ncbi:hypothetical protein [Levilactobacillus brevis]|uniref:hypothetical protein n=2 Tax=Levilactobacillus brevis TaxID=1580 RepID=UPI0012F4E69D|nr:hypothetical protein [Levilactobacillus brevis]
MKDWHKRGYARKVANYSMATAILEINKIIRLHFLGYQLLGSDTRDYEESLGLKLEMSKNHCKCGFERL